LRTPTKEVRIAWKPASKKLVDVLLAENISTRALLERDLALIKVSAISRIVRI